MPIKKKSESIDGKEIKICPYCANEIKAGAKKCMYCKESLIEKIEFDNDDGEMKQVKNKTKRIWGRILALSIPIIGIVWLIISMIFYFITVNGGESELIFAIKKTINWLLGILCVFGFFFTIRGIIILSKSNSKSDGSLKDGDKIDSENVKSSMKLADVTKGFMYGYIIRVFIDFLLAFSGRYVGEGTEIFLNFVFIVGALVAQIVRWFKTYRGLQKAQIGGLAFPTGRGRLVFGWICPIACLYMPYQIVRDIMNAYKFKTGKNVKGSIVGRWWGISLIGGAVNSALLRQSGNGDVSIIIFSYILDILEYVLFIVLLTKIQNMQKEYLESY